MIQFPRLKPALLIAALIAAPSLFAQKTNPKPLTVTQPKYPAELVDSGQSGVATIAFVVKADGSVADPVLKSADHPAFGTEAMAVVPQWKFQPGTRDGAAVDMPVEIPIQFRAPPEQKINALAKRKVYAPVAEPVLTAKEFGKLKPKNSPKPTFPGALAKSGLKQDVKVKFIVAPDGTTLNPQIEGEPKVELILPTIMTVAAMTFEPPVKNKKPVYVEGSTSFHFEEPPAAPKGAKGKGGRGGGGDGPIGGGPGDP